VHLLALAYTSRHLGEKCGLAPRVLRSNLPEGLKGVNGRPAPGARTLNAQHPTPKFQRTTPTASAVLLLVIALVIEGSRGAAVNVERRTSNAERRSERQRRHPSRTGRNRTRLP
jgi:hypothetical protein